MRMIVLLAAIGALFLTFACEDSQRVSRLEKENQELQGKLKAQQAQDTARNYELIQKCSEQAKAWFRSNSSAEKDMILLNYNNHYNKAQNRCYIFIEHHFKPYIGEGWNNAMSLWDVQENLQYGEYLSRHFLDKDNDSKEAETVYECKVYGITCKGSDDFNRLIRPYLND
jgi:hypothetical protein